MKNIKRQAVFRTTSFGPCIIPEMRDIKTWIYCNHL